MKQTKRTVRLVEAALMVALATALSLFKLADLPYGGSITLASMLPLLLLSYRHGVAWGLGGGVVYAVLQLLLGLNNLSWFTTWQSVLAVILLDYIVAFTVTGLGGILRRVCPKQHVALSLGAVGVGVLRYACHVIAGATVWAGLSIPTEAALLYSLGYNATYMLPETVVLVAAAWYLGSVLDFRRDVPVRLVREGTTPGTGLVSLLSGLVLLCGVVADTVLILSQCQNPETGAFDLAGLASEPFADSIWLPVTVITAVCLVAATLLWFVARRKKAE